MSTVLAQWGTIMLLLGLATAAQWGTISIHGGVIIGRKQGRSMQIFAYPSRSPTDVNVVDNTLFWTTVEVQFANGTIKSVAPLHGLSGVIAKAGHFVGIGDLTGKGGVHPAGLVMTVTFSGNTVMDEVHILYSSPVTHIVHYNKEIAAMPGLFVRIGHPSVYLTPLHLPVVSCSWPHICCNLTSTAVVHGPRRGQGL